MINVIDVLLKLLSALILDGKCATVSKKIVDYLKEAFTVNSLSLHEENLVNDSP